MAWIEQRRRRFVVHTRIDGVKTKGPSYADRADAELFIRLADHAGWDSALAYVTSTPVEAPEATASVRSVRQRAIAAGALDSPEALPVTDPCLPTPPGREPSGISVGELVRMHISTRTARAKTVEQYRSYVRDHVDPYFGDLDAAFVIRYAHPVAEGTNAMNIVAWRNWLEQQPVMTRDGRPTGRTLASKTIKNVMSLVASAYDMALTDEFCPLVSFNPVTGMAPTTTAPDEIERVFLSPEQFRALNEHTIAHYRHLMLFLVLTGVRWGEAAGLRVRDVCLQPESGRPYQEVRVALKRVRGGSVLGLLKSRAARRRLTIPAPLLPILSAAIEGKGPDDTVFTSPQGGRLHHGNVTRNLEKAVMRARAAGSDIPDVTLHALRHSAAAWLLSAGRTPYQVSRQLGHETEATTQKYYGHLVRTEYDANADALEEILVDSGWAMAEHEAIDVIPTADDQALTLLDSAEIDGDDASTHLAA